jgi:hypothetical protein
MAACALVAASARAQVATVDALQAWGLLGWWSLRCDQPVSSSNFYYGYVIGPDGRAYHQRDLGDPDRSDKSEILSAEQRADGMLSITVNFTSISQVRQVVFLKEPGRIRAWYNRGPNNDVTVDNGIFRHNGQPTPWQYKCR